MPFAGHLLSPDLWLLSPSINLQQSCFCCPTWWCLWCGQDVAGGVPVWMGFAGSGAPYTSFTLRSCMQTADTHVIKLIKPLCFICRYGGGTLFLTFIDITLFSGDSFSKLSRPPGFPWPPAGAPLITALASKLLYSTSRELPTGLLVVTRKIAVDVIFKHFSDTYNQVKLSLHTLRPGTKIRHRSLDGRHLSTQSRATAPVKRPRLVSSGPCGGCFSTVKEFQKNG